MFQYHWKVKNVGGEIEVITYGESEKDAREELLKAVPFQPKTGPFNLIKVEMIIQEPIGSWTCRGCGETMEGSVLWCQDCERRVKRSEGVK